MTRARPIYSRWKSRRIRHSTTSSCAAKPRSPPTPTGPAASWRPGSSPPPSTGTASPTPTATAAASAARSLRRSEGDSRPVRFTFVSCQDMSIGAANAYRRMIYEDERRPRAEQLGFVLHLGDFIYEVINYRGRDAGGQVPRPPPAPAVQVPRRRQVPRLPPARDARRTTARVYRAYLTDPDLQDARARWPFVPRVGQPRVLVAGIPERPGVRRQAAPSADLEGRGQPGVVGIPAGACRTARCGPRPLRGARGQGHAH